MLLGMQSLFYLFAKCFALLTPLQKGLKLKQFATFELLFAFPVLLSFFRVPSVSASQLPSSFASVVAVCYVFLSAPREKKPQNMCKHILCES